MPIETTSQTSYDGVRNVVMQFTGDSADGSDETNVIKVDVSELSPPCSRVSVAKIDYNITGPGKIKLLWGGDPAHEEFLVLSGQGTIDYPSINGLPNVTAAPTGDILLSTVDFDLGSAYSLILTMKKKY